MKWGDPDLLFHLALLAAAIVILAWMRKGRAKRLRSIAEDAALATLLNGWNAKAERRRFALWAIAFALMGAALLRPQWGFHWEQVRQRGLDIMVVLDTSRSMLAEDLKPNRLQQAKWGVSDLVRRLKGDRVGLVAFAGSSFLQCPLTVDYSAFLMTLDDVRVGIIPRGGTAIAQGLRTAIDSFDKGTESDRLILLITDGEDHEGKPESLARELKDAGIRVFAIGVGSREGELIPQTDETGRTAFFKDNSGNVVKTSLREDALETIALATDGVYIRATAGDLGIDRLIEQEWAGLQRRESESRMVRNYEDRFQWFLAAALALLAAEAAISERRRDAAT